MTPGKVRAAVAASRLQAIESMLAGIESLPLRSREEFTSDPRMVAAGESFLRRALEALFDLGRHLLAKAFGDPASEYKEIAQKLGHHGILDPDSQDVLVKMAGYRNRLVHFYDEVTPSELHEILVHRRDDVQQAADALRAWLDRNPERLDDSL